MINLECPPIETHIGRQLKKRRLFLNIKQYGLAKLMDITPQQLSKYEKGIDRIPASRLYQLCKILSVTPNFFFEGLDGICFSSIKEEVWLYCDNLSSDCRS
ncbi:helix-turn-helix domain-containing protein [Candidatus Odyssella acanthamoebae]|uniref:helix-turn-helix domain-containing protein n=1 Tax=Candidatus Odyssella acanthamoebae TaxID=91604 RepID=UPI000691BB72|nr:helix-turn-helix transcriptional regulator [Candidatus Paracaedibacter acanthamoebae]